MSRTRRLLFPVLLVSVSCAPALASAAQGIDDLDVTIRIIDRQHPGQSADIDAFINRIELPANRPPGSAEHTRRSGEPGGDRRDGRRDPGRSGSERGRDSIRERADRGASHAEERRSWGADIAESARDNRGRETREEYQHYRRDPRDD